MDSKTRRKIKNRMMTIISKLEELKALGSEDIEIGDALPSSMEGFSQDLISVVFTDENLN